MKSQEQRIAELEAKLAQLQRELARKPSREMMPLPARRGWFLGITRAVLAQGGAVDVDAWIWSNTLSAWRKANVVIPDCRDWFLNDGEEIETLTKVKVEWYETTWAITAAYCSPTDLPELQPTIPPESPDPIPELPIRDPFAGPKGNNKSGSDGYADAFNSSTRNEDD